MASGASAGRFLIVFIGFSINRVTIFLGIYLTMRKLGLLAIDHRLASKEEEYLKIVAIWENENGSKKEL